MRYSSSLIPLPFLLPFISATPDAGPDAAGSTSANTTRPASSCTGNTCSTPGSQWNSPGASLQHTFTYPNGSIATYQVKTTDLIANINSAIEEAISGHPQDQSIPIPYCYNNVTISSTSSDDSAPSGFSISYASLVAGLQFIGAKLPTDDQTGPIAGGIAAMPGDTSNLLSAAYNIVALMTAFHRQSIPLHQRPPGLDLHQVRRVLRALELSLPAPKVPRDRT